MSVKEIQASITQLSPPELSELVAWLKEYDRDAWDTQIERDLDSGRFDQLLAEVEREYQSGMAQPF